MIYLSSITLPPVSNGMDAKFGSFYPYNVILSFNLEKIDFEPITIFYGNNGSGKSTLLNIIAEKAQTSRGSGFNKSSYFVDFANLCDISDLSRIPEKSRFIASDDVFDLMLDIRTINKGIDLKRPDICEEYWDAKYDTDFKFTSISDYDRIKEINESRKKTQTKFVEKRIKSNIKEQSNGENAFNFFIEKIDANGLYILDEPENSLSPKRQIELKSFIEESARFFGCQFIISTHSPFLLSLHGAKIYDLDESPVVTKKWTELENVRLYRNFFEENI